MTTRRASPSSHPTAMWPKPNTELYQALAEALLPPPDVAARSSPRRQAAMLGPAAVAGRRRKVALPPSSGDAAAKTSPPGNASSQVRRRSTTSSKQASGEPAIDIKSPRDIGREAKACRNFRMLKQSDVARACGVSRQWVSDFESGKATLELGLVLRAYEELGLELTAKRSDDPPRWTVVLTADAEMRESRSRTRRWRRRREERRREEMIKEGNLVVD